MSTLGAAFAATAVRRGAATALLFEGVEYSYRLIADRAATVAGALRQRGVRPGDRVAVGLANSPELVVAVLGVIQAGAVLVPLNPAHTADELVYIAGDSSAHLALVEANHAAILMQAAPPELAAILTAGDLLSAAPISFANVDPEAPAGQKAPCSRTGRCSATS